MISILPALIANRALALGLAWGMVGLDVVAIAGRAAGARRIVGGGVLRRARRHVRASVRRLGLAMPSLWFIVAAQSAQLIPGRHCCAEHHPGPFGHLVLQVEGLARLRLKRIKLFIKRRPRRLYVLSDVVRSLIHSTFSF